MNDPRHIDPSPSPLWPTRRPIQRVAGLTRDEFERRFLTSNGGAGEPVIVTDALDRWPAKAWTLDHFRRRFGDLKVRAWCRSSRRKPYQPVGYEMPLAAYIDYVERGDLTKPPAGAVAVSEATELESAMGTLYWYENLGRPEFAPLLDEFDNDLYFIDNLQARLRGDWKRAIFYFPFSNIFIGGPGTCVDMHKDYWSSHTVIAEIVGRKHAILFPPGDAPYVHNAAGEPIDPRNVDPAEFPAYAKATLYEGTLNGGEMLFMPPDWYHDVLGLEPSLAIGMNFFTVHNIGEYLPNLLSYPLQLYSVLDKHPTLRAQLHDAEGRLLPVAPATHG
ncbi:MAG TPA: cupin-like domain-containing protein [Gemmatimonadaceae bacterium]|nr:cupin-like domain-containing protein [Gemmatimonadaceae bacterium]